MKITILNKNRINNTGSYNISNLNSYEIDEGFTYTKCFNKTLDSANIRLSHLTSKIDIEPLDEVLLNDDTRFSDIYMCVDTFNIIEESLDPNNITYTYEITLFSQTKKLEGVLLPNLSITPLRVGTKRSVRHYLEQYLTLYGEKIRYIRPDEIDPQQDAYVFDNAYNFSQRLLDRFDNVVCPELQWNEPTLREVIDDLLMVDNCIATLNNGVIDYLDLEELTGNEITNYNYVRETRSAEDYVSDIKMDLKNALQTNIDNVKDTITTIEYITFTSDDYVINTDNFFLKTKYPILQVKSCLLCMLIGSTDGNFYTLQLPSLELVDSQYPLLVEYKEYQTRNVLRTVGNYDPSKTLAYYSQYQNYSVYYNRNSNIITGFTNLSKKYDLFEFSKNTLMLLNEIMGNANFDIDFIRPYQFMVKLEYTSAINQVFSAGKSEYPNNYRQIKDNQTNSWVDAYTQGKLEYSKANRLGNLSKIINQRHKTQDNGYAKIGDKKDNAIVYQTEYQVYKDHIEVNALATDYYVLKNFFTGVDRKIRTWVNAQNEAFERHDLLKYYCEFSFTNKNEYGFLLSKDKKYANYLLSPLYETQIDPMRSAIIYSGAVNQTYACELLARQVGDSVVLTTNFNDNTIAGYYIDEVGTVVNVYGNYATILSTNDKKLNGTLNGAKLGYYSYVDSNCECNYFNVKIGNKSILEYFNQITYSGIDDAVENHSLFDKTIGDQVAQNRFNYPLVNSNVMVDDRTRPNYYIFDETEFLYKDNKEIPVFSIQAEFCCENRDIYFTKYFIQNQLALRLDTGDFKTYESDNWYYGDEILRNDEIINNSAIISVSNNSNRVDITNLTKKNIYIVDGNDKIMLGIKRDTNNSSLTFYLNILKNRNKTIYNSNRVKIGEL